MSRIAVVGPGGVGTFFAAQLAAAGRDVVACARRPFDEYVVDSATAPVRAPALVLTRPAQVKAPVDWVLVAVKAHQIAEAAPWFHRLCGEGTTVVSVQNGVEGEERLAPLVGGADVLAAVVYCGAELLAPGHTRHDSAGYLILPDVDAAHRLAELFVGTGAQVRISAAHAEEAYRKLGINVVVNGITALTGQRIFGRVDRPSGRRPLPVIDRPNAAVAPTMRPGRTTHRRGTPWSAHPPLPASLRSSMGICRPWNGSWRH